jgi:hypothetical protein
MQQVSGSIPLSSTNQKPVLARVPAFFLASPADRCPCQRGSRAAVGDPVEGYLISPVPVTLKAIPCGEIVLTNNLYNALEETIVCR